MKRMQLFFLILVCAVGFTLAQTTQFTRTLKKADGTLLEGYTDYIWIVPQANTYPTGALALTERVGSPGNYYRDNVPYGVYKIYIDMDKTGPGSAVLKYENLPVVDNRMFSIADKFNSSAQLGTDGIQDNAITKSKINDATIVRTDLGSSYSMKGTYSFDGNSTVNVYNIMQFATGGRLIAPDTYAGINDWKAISISGSSGSSWLTFNYGTSLNDSMLSKRWLRESFSGTDLKPASITLSNLTQSVIDYINGSGGGTINNFPDDITTEIVNTNQIGLKQSWVNSNLVRISGYSNLTGQKNFLGGAKFGNDSSVSVVETTMNEYFEFKRKQNTGLAGWVFKVVPNDTFLQGFQLRSLEPANDDYGDPYDHHFASYYIGTGIDGLDDDATALYLAWEVGYKSPYSTSPGSIIDEWWLGWEDSISGAQHRPIFLTFERKTNQQMASFNVDHFVISGRNGPANPAFDFYDTGDDGDLAVLQPSLAPTLHSTSSYLLVGDHAKIYSISERDTNWLIQGGYSLIKYGTMAGGTASAIWVNPNPGTATTRIGNNLIVYSNTSNKGRTVFWSGGTLPYLTNSELSFNTHVFSVTDTAGAYSIFFDAQQKHMTIGSTPETGTGRVYAGSYYTGSTLGYLVSAWGSATPTTTGYWVASSSGGSPTTQLNFRNLTINGTTVKVLVE